MHADYAESYLIFFAVLAHKWVTALSLGVTVLRATQRLDVMVKLISIFACSTPLGS